MNTHYQTLLTGAGFSHNFGLYLASQMWEHIFNRPEIHQSQPLKFIFERIFNYEQIIEVVSRDHPDELKGLFSGLNGVYGDMDSILKKSLDGQVPSGINMYTLRDWLKSFVGEGKSAGHIFTLNHDLFIERFSNPDFRPHILGVPTEAQCESVRKTSQIVPTRLDKLTNIDKSSNCNLVKLHGSCNWFDEKFQLTMIVGGGKRKSIEQSEALTFYKNEFQRVLRETRLLWIAGYGFSDEHVNECISEAIQSNDLKLAIIHPFRPNDFFKLLDEHAGTHAAMIKRSMRGYFPHTLGGIFQVDDNNTMPHVEMRRISREFYKP